jgi:ABC-type transport system substrate-binding protein
MQGAPWEGGVQWERVGRAVYETLVQQDENEKIVPWLAETWKIAPDGKNITFTLRKGVKFQDGTDFNAEAVKYSMESWPKGSAGAVILSAVTSYDVIDPYTIRFNLKQYDAVLMMQLAAVGPVIVSPTAAKKATTPDKQPFDHMVGTGPYKLVDFKRDNFFKFAKWDGYWQKGRPFPDTVEFRAVADLTTRTIAFKAGEGNVCEPLQPLDRVTLEKQGFVTNEGTMGFVMPIIPAGADPKSPFADLRVREAVEYAIDKVGLYKGLFANYWPPAYQQALANDPYFNPNVTPRVFNVAKAKQLLADAGYPKGFKTVLHMDNRGQREWQEAIRQFLADVGIDAAVDLGDAGRYNTLAQQGWDGIIWPGFPNPSSTTSLMSRFGTATWFPSMYRPPGYQEAWASVATQTDENIRINQVRELLKVMADNAMVIPLWETHPAYALNKTTNVVMDLDWCGKKSTNWWNPAGVWIKK